eukprot:COSAG02_NODE_31617_length_530_cov_1.211137_1_plen_135_part_01
MKRQHLALHSTSYTVWDGSTVCVINALAGGERALVRHEHIRGADIKMVRFIFTFLLSVAAVATAQTCDGFDCSADANDLVSSPGDVTCAADPCTAAECCTEAQEENICEQYNVSYPGAGIAGYAVASANASTVSA